MSRIGNKPIAVPQGVKIALEGGQVEVQGPKGKLSVAVPRGITFEHKDGTLVAKRSTEEHRALHGLARCSSVERSEEHTSELQSRGHLVCRLLLEKKK